MLQNSCGWGLAPWAFSNVGQGFTRTHLPIPPDCLRLGPPVWIGSTQLPTQLPGATPIVRQSWTTLLAKSEAAQARPATTLSDHQTALSSLPSLSRSCRSRARHLDHLCFWGLGRVGLLSSNSAASTFLSWPTSWTFMAICLKVFWKRRPSDQLAASAFGVWCGVTENLVLT